MMFSRYSEKKEFYCEHHTWKYQIVNHQRINSFKFSLIREGGERLMRWYKQVIYIYTYKHQKMKSVWNCTVGDSDEFLVDIMQKRFGDLFDP